MIECYTRQNNKYYTVNAKKLPACLKSTWIVKVCFFLSEY